MLQELHHYHNKQTGLQWGDLTCYIEESALGRKLTPAQLRRFVEKNLLTINLKDRKRYKPTSTERVGCIYVSPGPTLCSTWPESANFRCPQNPSWRHRVRFEG